MKLTGNTILITGGGSGIGRGLAEAFHKLGNKVIISGRRRRNLDEVVAANPGMVAIELDITDPSTIESVSNRLIADHPDLNVLINNAGIMLPDRVAGRIDDELLVDTVTTNLVGSIRMTSALIEHLKAKDDAVIAYMSSVLGFVPMAVTAVYSATKAALHSYSLSQRGRRRSRRGRPPRIRAVGRKTGCAFAERHSDLRPVDSPGSRPRSCGRSRRRYSRSTDLGGPAPRSFREFGRG
jgi:uncharacterized oxidoreductase